MNTEWADTPLPKDPVFLRVRAEILMLKLSEYMDIILRLDQKLGKIPIKTIGDLRIKKTIDEIKEISK